MRPVYSVETRSDKNIKKKNKSHVFQLHQVLSFALICLLGALKNLSSHSTGHLHDRGRLGKKMKHILYCTICWYYHLWRTGKRMGFLPSRLAYCQRRADGVTDVMVCSWELRWTEEMNYCKTTGLSIHPKPFIAFYSIYICLKCCLRNSNVTCKLLPLGISLCLIVISKFAAFF